jgi:hypothetical protein
MNNESQVKLILEPALQEFIDSIKKPTTSSLLAWTTRNIVINSKITADSIINTETIVSLDTINAQYLTKVKFDDISKTYKTARINVLLSKVPEYQLIPELITHLKVYNEGKYYSGVPIQKYVFPNSTLESQKEQTIGSVQSLESPQFKKEDDGDKSTLQLDSLKERHNGDKETLESPKGLGEEDDGLGKEDDGNKSLQEVIGGKKKSKTINKLYRGSGTMYSRRKTKHNHRY